MKKAINMLTSNVQRATNALTGQVVYGRGKAFPKGLYCLEGLMGAAMNEVV
jgi:hypothetical protein